MTDQQIKKLAQDLIVQIAQDKSLQVKPKELIKVAIQIIKIMNDL